MLVLILFFCSGATALVYEVLWSKYLALMFGSTVQAQTVILAVFMGGLAIGNRLFGNRADALKQPLATYGFLEIGIGIFAFLFYQLYHLADLVFIAIGTGVFGWSSLLLVLKLSISMALLLLPTILMGGTLPLLASWIQKHTGLDWSSRVSLFYAINSLGAVTGAGLAGFFLVQKFGMVFSLQIVATVNVVIGLIALVISKRDVRLTTVAAPATQNETSKSNASSWAWLPILVAVTGGVSMGLEVLSSRALALIVGGSLQAFALVLMSFIFGIGIGSLFIASSRTARKGGVYTIYLLLLIAAVLVGLSLMGIKEWVLVYSQAKWGLASNPNGYVWHQVIVGLMGLVVLGLPAAFIGATVPLSISLVERYGIVSAAYVGRLLTWNTVGAVAGVMLTGFVLMPFVGLRGSIASLALVLLGAVAFLAWKRSDQKVLISSLAVGVALLIGINSSGENWRRILTAGVFRIRDHALTLDHIKKAGDETELLFYKDAPDATVSVHSFQGPGQPLQRLLKINGKTDASTYGDTATQYLLAHLPMMAKPDAREVFVLGFGSGTTAGALLGHPVNRITVAENCKPVLEAAPLFGEWNHGVLTNGRARVFNEDARTVLKLSPQKYDVIICEPSNPWVVGVGSVFSKDFYELASSRLNDDGIMAQWFHIYEMNDFIVDLVIRTFASVFPEMEVWDVETGDIVLLGSKKPWLSTPEQYQKVFARPVPKADLQKIGLSTPVAVWARQMASQRTAFALAGEGPIQTDEFPILEYEAPKAFFVGATALGLFALDERTWQFALAPADKVKTLRALPRKMIVESLQMIIGSCNIDLNRYRLYLAGGGAGGTGSLDPRTQIIFRAPADYPEAVMLAPDASKENETLTRLELQILRNPENARTPIANIDKILSQMIAEHKLTADFSPQFYAAMGARFAMKDGDYLQAMRLLKVGMVFAPEGQQLLYLSRVLDRLVPPEMLEKLKAEKSASSTNSLPRISG